MNKPSQNGLVRLFAVLMVLATVLECIILGSIARVKQENRRRDAYFYGQSVADAIMLTLENTVEATEALKYIYMNYGEDWFGDFEKIAADIDGDNPEIASIYIAPEGVIRLAYPESVQSATIGFAMLLDEEQGPRAELAVDSKQITVAGPHELIEGGVGFIIRNPIFDGERFVGFTIIVLDWDIFAERVMANASVSTGKYNFAVWKDTPDEHAVTDEDGYILRSTSQSISRRVDIEFEVPNDTWHLVVEPTDGWRVINEMWGDIAVSVGISLAMVLLCVLYIQSAARKRQLEKQQLESETRQQYTEQLTEALANARKAEEAKSAFLTNMSHDIRTPMNAILGFANLMEKEPGMPENALTYLKKIRESGDYLLSLINNVLDMARIDSGRETLNETFCDLCVDGDMALSLFEGIIAKKHITFVQSGDIQHRYVFCDQLKQRQIWLNLVSNAVKYTPDGGTVSIDIREHPCDREGYATYVTTLKDNGIGMSSDFLEHIFDSFARERNSTESKIAGTGLGMSIVKKLVDIMGGTICVESEPGAGTTFTVALPFRIAEAPEKAHSESREPNAGDMTFAGRRVLLAEDNELNAEIAATMLNRAGFLVERAADGMECLQMLREADSRYFDVVLMDVQMPNMDGYSATRNIRLLEDKTKSQIPIVALTANAFDEDKQKALEAGMNGHLTKPVEISKLLELLSDILKPEDNSHV